MILVNGGDDILSGCGFGILIAVSQKMKETIFYILLNIKTGNGWESIGKFFIGNDRDFAYQVFHKLRGNRDVDENTVLHLELMETRQGLPFNLLLLGCSLEEVAENCRVITRETFKLFNLEGH